MPRPGPGAGDRFLLGVDDDGIAYFAVLEDAAPGRPDVDGVAPAGLREVGALLGDRDAGLLVHAVALANWHATHTRCPRCGERHDGRGGGPRPALPGLTAPSTTRAPTRP